MKQYKGCTEMYVLMQPLIYTRIGKQKKTSLLS